MQHKLLKLIGGLLLASAAAVAFAESKDVDKNKMTNQAVDDSSEYVVLQPVNQATFLSDIAASVAKVNVKQGSTFKKDEVLVEMDCRVQQADLKEALARQQAAEVAFKGAEKMKGYGSISELEYVKAKTEAQAAQADVDKIEAIVDRCTIEAPYNGAVSLLKVHVGDSIKPGDVILKIISVEGLVVELQVPSHWLRWLHVGTPFQIHINELDRTYAAKVVRIDPLIDSISQTVKIVGDITNPDAELFPGMSGKASFPDKTRQTQKSK